MISIMNPKRSNVNFKKKEGKTEIGKAKIMGWRYRDRYYQIMVLFGRVQHNSAHLGPQSVRYGSIVS
jgi:hypothetical protein